MDRFWSKVEKKESGCWEWAARKDRAGYGEFHLNGATVKAHRVSYSLKNPSADINGMCVLHSCDNPSCVNPHHLFLGSHADNVSDKCKKGRGRFRPHLGSKNGCSKLTEEQVKEIRELKGRVIQTVMAERYGVSQALISLILLKKGWKHVI